MGGWATSLCLGAATAPRAEATALLLALRWLRQLLHLQYAEQPWVEFVFDCLSIAQVAKGEHGASTNTDIGIVVQSMIHWLQPACAEPFYWTFQPSHTGHPWNEAADTLCRRTVKTQEATVDMKTYHAQCTFDGTDVFSIQWLWLLERSMHHYPDAPALHNGSWRFNIASPLTQTPQGKHHPFVQRCQEQDDGLRTAKWFSLQVATANVLTTLFPGQDYASSFFSARAEALAAQWHEGGIHFVGLQETRSRLAGHARLGDFHVLSYQRRPHPRVLVALNYG